MDEEVLQAEPSEPSYELRPPVAIKVFALVLCIILGVASLMFLVTALRFSEDLMSWFWFVLIAAFEAMIVILYLIAKRQRFKLDQGVFSYTNGLCAVKYAKATDVTWVVVKTFKGMLGCKIVFFGAEDEVLLSFSDDVGTIFRGGLFPASLAYYGIPLYFN